MTNEPMRAIEEFDRFYHALPGGRVCVEERGGSQRVLEHHVHHSPDGHSWGYLGSGPAELAKDILWDHMGVEPNPAMYQDFKSDIIARIPQNAPFEMDRVSVASWCLQWQQTHPGVPMGADGL